MITREKALIMRGLLPNSTKINSKTASKNTNPNYCGTINRQDLSLMIKFKTCKEKWKPSKDT